MTLEVIYTNVVVNYVATMEALRASALVLELSDEDFASWLQSFEEHLHQSFRIGEMVECLARRRGEMKEQGGVGKRRGEGEEERGGERRRYVEQTTSNLRPS